MRFSHARALLVSAQQARAFPAAAIEVGTSHDVLWRDAIGRLTYDDEAAVCDAGTVFDLASLTKVIATASAAMRLVGTEALALDGLVGDVLPDWRPLPLGSRDSAHASPSDRAAIRVRHLLDHSSGLPAHARLWERLAGRDAYVAAIHALPLDRAPGTAAVYSDVGFILLGFVLEHVAAVPLDAQFNALATASALGDIRFLPPPAWHARMAPTEIDPWRGRLIQGEVHDENAAALGGVAAHAGLFGTAASVGAFARLVLETFARETPLGAPPLMREFATRSRVAGSSRALGWDTMLPTSSCGTRMSAHAIGHTGFTGTSLWIDPERDVYVVLLTNRVHPTRELNALAALRPVVHDAVMEAL